MGSSSGTTYGGVSVPMGLLPGIKFSPTDEELLSFYLKKKIAGEDSEFSHIIREINVREHEPRDLPEFFFSEPDYMSPNGNSCYRTTNEGFYKSSGDPREIEDELSKAVIGEKRYMSFYEGRAPEHKLTNHALYQFSLTKTELAKLGPNREFVLNHLTIKKRKYDSTKARKPNNKKRKYDSNGDKLAEPGIPGYIASNYKDDQASAAANMIPDPEEYIADKNVLLGSENRNEGAESESANGFSSWSDFDDLLKEPSCDVLGENLDSTFLPPQQLAATSATSFGGFGVVGSPDGFWFYDFDDPFKQPFCAHQPHQPPHPHQPPPAPHPHLPPPTPQSHQPPLPSQPQNYFSSTLPSALCTKQGNVPSLYNDDCSKKLSPTGNNISTKYQYEPVRNTGCSVQNGATDERFSEAYFQQEENLGICSSISATGLHTAVTKELRTGRCYACQ